MNGMSKGVIFLVLGFIACMASFVMFRMGHANLHLSQFRTYWFAPLPLGLIFGGIGTKCLLDYVKS